MNDMNGILRNPDGPAPQNSTSNDVSNEIDKTITQNKGENQNNIACHGTSNDSNYMNGLLDKPRENSTCNNVPNDNTTNKPTLPPYVYRLGHSDRFACKFCSIRDDKWGMVKHHHPEAAGKKQ
jgi:hypothetical protein